MNNIFSFIEKNNNINEASKSFFKIPSFPDLFLREFLLDYWDEINKYFFDYWQQINSLDNYDKVYDYFFLSECQRMKIYSYDIENEENKQKFRNICNDVENYLKKYSILEIQKIILNNFLDFLKKDDWLKKLIFWFFWDSEKNDIFFEKIKDIDFYQTFIIDNFKNIKEKFIQHQKWCIYFFDYERLKKYLNNGMIINNWFIDFLLEFKNIKNQTIKHNYGLFENFLFEQLEIYHSKIENIDNNSWMENYMILENIYHFFIKNKTHKIECMQIENDMKLYENKYLEKYGKKHTKNRFKSVIWCLQ